MATLGSLTTGFTFTISGSFGDVAGGPWTVPSPGIFVSNINVYAGNNGSSSTDRLYVWQDSAGIPGAAILHSAGTFAMGGTRAWQTRSDIAVNAGHLTSDGYIPAGTKIWIGIFASTGVLAVEGAGSGTTQLGFTNDGDWNNNGPAGGGMGVLGAYVTYSPLAAPTLSSASPNVAPVGQTTVLTGTNLLHTTGITVCGVTATTYTITDDSHITVTVPAGASGAGNIVVTTPAGTASIAFTAGQIKWGDASGSGVVHSIVAIKYGDASGSGVVHTAIGVWVPNGAGVKRVW